MTGVGVAGWSYADWEGRVYPRHKKRGFHPLAYLARYVDLMEVNSSFYALPDPRHVAKWMDRVEDRPSFRFVLKLHRAFTHEPVRDWRAEALAFRNASAPAREAERLLGLLVQFPVSFCEGEAGWQRLRRIHDAFPDETLCLELRHRSWFSPEALERLRDLGVGLVHIDLPASQDHPPDDHPTLGPLVYVRLHGRNRRTWFDREAGRDERYDYRYSKPELDDVARRVVRLAKTAERSIVVANNHFEGQAVANALELKALLSGLKPKAPETLVAAYPDLADVTEPDMTDPSGQARLF